MLTERRLRSKPAPARVCRMRFGGLGRGEAGSRLVSEGSVTLMTRILGVLVAAAALTGGAGVPAGVATAAPLAPTAVDLGTFGSAVAVNAAGQVVGVSTTAGDAETHATLWR
jgi:probable HAF family extracellular repeat protein